MAEAKKSQSRIKKEEEVEELTKNFKQTKNIIFWEYAGFSVPQFQQLREQLAQTQAKVKVTKNTLINLALKNSKLQAVYTGSPSLLEGPTAILFTNDEAVSLKILSNFIKNSGLGKLKFGFLNGQFADSTALEFLAILPSHSEIMAQVANLLARPIYNLINVLEGNLRSLVYVLAARG